MKRLVMIFGICFFLFLFAYATVRASGQGQTDFSRTITGTVVDKEELPVEGANVCAWGTGPMAGRLPCGQSSSTGRFAIDVHRADTYTLVAEHFEKGYPEANSAFYGKLFRNFPVVTVDQRTTPSPAKITLGPKAGCLALTLLDGATNEPIEKGLVTLCRVGEPKSCWSMSTSFPNGRYDVLTPEVPFTIKFETWHGEWGARSAFDEAGVLIDIVQLDLGAQKQLTIRLN